MILHKVLAFSGFLLLQTIAGCLHTHAGTRVIDSFSAGSGGERASLWTPGPGMPAQISGAGFLKARFPYRFSKQHNRVYWDRPVHLDLSKTHALEFEFYCKTPSDIKSMAFYLKSGDGWYVWIRRIDETGRQKLRFNMGEAGVEGEPSGLHDITGLRISFYGSGSRSEGVVSAYSLTARVYPVVLIQATSSAPNQAERAFAAGVTRRMSKWLFNAGIEHAVITDDDAAKGLLDGSGLAVLCYNPVLPERMFRQVESFVRGGGKLVVFYSSDERLARLMGVRLGDYTRSSSPDEWTHFVFSGSAPRGVPKVVYQTSTNIRPVFPEAEGASVIACWNRSDGKPAYPAWVKTRRGLWMTHVLLKGDDEDKTMMLLGLFGDALPRVWRMAAEHYLRECGRFGPFANAREAMVGLRKTAPRGVIADVDARIKEAQKEFDGMCLSYAEGDYASTVLSARNVRKNLVKAFATAQEPVGLEIKGVWDHSGTGLFPGDWAKTCSLLSAGGINAVFPNFASAGVAHYQSSVLSGSSLFYKHGDQVEQCVAAAERYGNAVHAWVVCWNPGGSAREFTADLRKNNRLQTGYDGKSVGWLCPAHPANRKLMLDVIRELASKQGLSGIHLDYMRFPSTRSCVCSSCRAAFEKWRGRKVANWPADVVEGGEQERFKKWRCELLTAFVAEARNMIKNINPDMKLSAAVYMEENNARNLGQDWPGWLEKGLVDFVTPMNYTESRAEFSTLLERQKQLTGRRGVIVPGIGVTASESTLSPEQVVEQIRLVEEAGMNGFILFDLNRTLQNEIFPVLNMGVTRRRAARMPGM